MSFGSGAPPKNGDVVVDGGMVVAGIASGDTFGSRAAAWLSRNTKSTHISTAVPATTPNMTTTDQVSALMLTSLCSCATSSLCISSAEWPCPAEALVGFMRERLLEIRVVDRQQGPAAQVARKEEEPDAGEAHRHGDVQ